MGPAATAHFFSRFTNLTPAKEDQDHVPTVICSIPQIPDRTDAIVNCGPTPLPAMLEALSLLERCGASQVAIPCSTAHYWFEELQEGSRLPIIHMIEAVAHSLQADGIPHGSVGLLATTGTICSDVYGKRMETMGYEVLCPDERDQAEVMSMIRCAKAGVTEEYEGSIRRLSEKLFKRGCQRVILGCTELPLLLHPSETQEFLDATEALAQACVRSFGLEACSKREPSSGNVSRKVHPTSEQMLASDAGHSTSLNGVSRKPEDETGVRNQ
jgi:aspartate racemase